MKIMHIIHGLNTGGAETLVKDYALNIDKEKYEVVILCLEHRLDSPYEKILSDNDIKVIYICDEMKYYGKNNLIFKCINYVQRLLLIKRYIKNECPDVIHSHLFVNQYIRFAKLKGGTRVFYTVHNEPKVLWGKKDYQRRIEFRATKSLVKKYGMRFIVLHEQMRKEINTMFNVKNSIILNNGIDFGKFENKEDRNRIREELGIPENSFVIGHVGTFSNQKNHEFLVDVFYQIIKENDKSFLLMVGSGLEKGKIRNKLNSLKLDKKYVILENRTDIPNLLNAMDVFVFPSLFEGLGISLIEAQKMNLPCFVSDRIPEAAIISNLVTKLPLDVDPRDWSKKILGYSVPVKIEMYDEGWDIKNIVKKLEDIYEDKI